MLKMFGIITILGLNTENHCRCITNEAKNMTSSGGFSVRTGWVAAGTKIIGIYLLKNSMSRRFDSTAYL